MGHLLLLPILILSALTLQNASGAQLGPLDLDETDEWRLNGTCPSPCECGLIFSAELEATLRTVNCARKGLKSFPLEIPTETQVLDLRGNHLSGVLGGESGSVGQTAPWLPALLALDLSYNRISSLGRPTSAGFFEGLYNLRRLNLRGNRIGHLHDHTFQGLFNLEDLDLSYNRVSGMRERALGGLGKLESLRLSGNKLTLVQPGWFGGLGSLLELRMDGNQLRMVGAESFRALPRLLLLDLARNHLFRLHRDAFRALPRLEYLHLSRNALASVPGPALAPLAPSLKSLSLSHNPIPRLAPGALAHFPALRELSLTSMPVLRLVQRGALADLPELVVAELHDNPFLAFLHPQAFVRTPRLAHLLLHNNNLTSLDRGLAHALPGLQEISFYGNPLACDCNAHWLRETVVRPTSHIRFREAERMVCDAPGDKRFKLLAALQDGEIPLTCGPRILPITDAQIRAKFGEDVELNCYAFGVPEVRVRWFLPNGQALSPGDSERVSVQNGGSTLVLKRVTESDSGVYRCVADNGVGTTEQKVGVEVGGLDVNLALDPDRIGATWATLSWAGGDRAQTVFQILFRPTDQPQARHQYAGTVTPIMTRYTLSGLVPDTAYEACLAVDDSAGVLLHLSCAQFRTRSLNLLLAGRSAAIQRTSNVAVGISLGVVASMLIVVCLAAVFLKRQGSREQPIYYDNLASPSINSLEQLHTHYVAPPMQKLPGASQRENVYTPFVRQKLPKNCTLNQSAKLEQLLNTADV